MRRVLGWAFVVGSLIAALLVAPGGAGSASAAGNAAMVLRPSASEVAVGGEIVVQVDVQDVQSLYGFEAHLSFDPALLEVVDAAPAENGTQVELLNSFLKPQFVAQNQADNSSGTIDLAFTQLAPTAPASGSGTIARITFRGKAAGSAAVRVLSVILADDKAQPITVSAEGAGFVVSGAAAQANQPTATATQAGAPPTPTLPAEGAEASFTATATPTSGEAATATAAPSAAVPTATSAPATTLASTATGTAEPTATEFTAAPTLAAQVEMPTVAAQPQQGSATRTPTAVPTQVATGAQATVASRVTAVVGTTAAPSDTPAATAAPVVLVQAAGATSVSPGIAGQAAEPAVARRGWMASPWFIGAVVFVLIVGFALGFVVPRERREQGK